jgi:chromate transporter
VPATGWLLYGVKPVILGVIVQAIVGLVPKAARTLPLVALGVAAAVSTLFGVHEIAVIFGAGAVAVCLRRGEPGRKGEGALRSWTPLLSAAVANGVATSFTLPSLFWVFLKTGSVLFGSGYVLVAFLRADLVERFGWLSEAQLIDAIAVGQVTPGPVFTTATFIGYVLAGPSGAVVATCGIFLPAFVFVALSGPLIPKIRASARAGAFLDGVNVASLALMAVVAMQLGRAAIIDAPTLFLAVTSAIALLAWKPNATWLVLGGAMGGYAAHFVGFAHAASP